TVAAGIELAVYVIGGRCRVGERRDKRARESTKSNAEVKLMSPINSDDVPVPTVPAHANEVADPPNRRRDLVQRRPER
ncbi:MAG TPA: hypothetical protein VLH10_05955, partial [Yinghuangia sp.]|nr:hypothetical protein [Yinghuangia sp.]